MHASLEPDTSQERDRLLAEQHAARRRRQTKLLARLDCFSAAQPDELYRLAAVCTFRIFPTGAEIISEGASGEFLYVVLHGALRLTLHDRQGAETLIGVLSRGDCFGEGPLFGDLFRGMTVASETAVYLLQIPLAPMRELLSAAPGLVAGLRQIYRHRLEDRTLARVPLFSSLSPLDRSQLAGLLEPRHIARGDYILRHGSPGDGLYLIESGQVSVERSGRVLAHINDGDFVGEMSLLTGEPHNADIRALTPTDVLILPVAAFHQLLADRPTIAEQLRAVATQRRRTNAQAGQDHEVSERLEQIVGRGLLRGARLLVRDPALCIEGCRLCETACTTRHGHPRIAVAGLAVGALAVTDTCRQCRVGAECIEVCPEQALQWSNHGAVVVTDACTGCGKCVEACPYDAVKLVDLPVPRQPTSLSTVWHALTHLRQPLIPLTNARPQRADKCDLCEGHADLACVSACPAGALKLVDVEEMFPL